MAEITYECLKPFSMDRNFFSLLFDEILRRFIHFLTIIKILCAELVSPLIFLSTITPADIILIF